MSETSDCTTCDSSQSCSEVSGRLGPEKSTSTIRCELLGFAAACSEFVCLQPSEGWPTSSSLATSVVGDKISSTVHLNWTHPMNSGRPAQPEPMFTASSCRPSRHPYCHPLPALVNPALRYKDVASWPHVSRPSICCIDAQSLMDRSTPRKSHPGTRGRVGHPCGCEHKRPRYPSASSPA